MIFIACRFERERDIIESIPHDDADKDFMACFLIMSFECISLIVR